MNAAANILATPEFWAAALVAAGPTLYAVLGALVCGRAGILNLGAEGAYIAGAFVAFVTVLAGGGPGTGLAAAIATGMGLGVLHGALAARLPPLFGGLAMTLLAVSLAQYVYSALVGGGGAT
ncbi:MAG: ABC transporter permease, partial [Proteobacteria bacterium]|nr:ABC transporter permease [Pseudomonadota bacterium]